jgi:hypothetical protein
MADCKGIGQRGRGVVIPLIPQNQLDHTVAPEPVGPDLIPDPADFLPDPVDPIQEVPEGAAGMMVEGVSDKSICVSLGDVVDYVELLL